VIHVCVKKLLHVYRTKTVGVRCVLLRVAVSLVPKVITTHTHTHRHTDGRADASAHRTKAAAIYDRARRLQYLYTASFHHKMW